MGNADLPEYHNPHARPGWDEYFIGVAKAVSKRGDCTRSQVGAVLVDDQSKRILSTGYNGVNPGQEGCLSGACPRGLLSFDQQPPGGDYSNCIAKHAEHNALEWWDVFNRSYLRGSSVSMYLTRSPCTNCQDLMREYGVRQAVYPKYWTEKVLYLLTPEYLDLTPNKGC